MQRVVVHPDQIQPPVIHLSAQQQHYLTRVLRLGQGDRFIALDGRGHAWLTQLAAPELGHIVEAIDVHTELPVAVTLVAALPKGSGFDDVVRQATELGVTTILPVISDRTLLQPSAQKLDRWRRIAQEAAEQSERQWVPTLPAAIPFAQYLATLPDDLTQTPHYLCVTRQHVPHLLACLPPVTSTPNPITIAIGPEGGWTEPEITQAIARGFQPVSLGARILRAVTAPLMALALIGGAYEQGTVRE